MAYTNNILTASAGDYVLNLASISNGVLSISAGGYAYTDITVEQLSQLTDTLLVSFSPTIFADNYNPGICITIDIITETGVPYNYVVYPSYDTNGLLSVELPLTTDTYTYFRFRIDASVACSFTSWAICPAIYSQLSGDIKALHASVDNIVSTYVPTATFNTVLTQYLKASDIVAESLTVDQLVALLARFQEVVAMTINAENIFSFTVSSDYMAIADAFITNAMIESLTANKIDTGTLNTSKVQILSNDGKFSIIGNTMQIKDTAGVTRVQIGKDASNDYNMYVWDAAGKLMFSSAGLEADAIKKAIIVDDMISASANIDASKIDVESVITHINAATTTITANKITFDGKQLDVSLSEMQTTVSDQGAVISNHQTSIEAVQGAISSKVWQADINTATGAMDTKYSTLSQTATGIQTQVSAINNDYVSKAAAATTEQNLKNYSDGKLSNYASTMAATVTSLQGQIDGSITTWFYAVAPTNSNVPAVNWTTVDLKNNHLGDLYYDTITGYCYRYQVVNNVYNWQRLTDTDVTKALSDAATAKDVADSKRRTFLSTPTVPYDAGDLWTQGAAGDAMVCTISRSTGSYIPSDWVKAVKYTDDTAVNNLQIGGRNRLKESSLLVTARPSTANYMFFTVNNITSQESTVNGYHYTATATNGAPNSSNGLQIKSTDVGLKVGDTFTFSSDIKGSFGTSNNGLCVMHATTSSDAFYAVVSGSTPHATSIPNWSRKSRQYTIPSNVKIESDGSFYIYLFWGGGTGSVVDVYVKNVKLEFGSKATDWTAAPEDVDASVKAISDSAAAAIIRLDDIMSDAKITPDEKQSLYKEWLTIASEKTANDTQADTFGITTEKTAYGTKYTALNTYVNTTYPLFSNLTTTTAIDSGDTLRTRFKEYYDARTALLNAIAVKSKTNLDNLQIGGKQLLFGTDGSWDIILDPANTNQTKLFQTTIPTWVTGRPDVFGGSLALRLLPTATDQYFAANQFCNKPCKVAGIYTISFYVKADSATTLRIGNRTAGTTIDTYKTVNITTSWQRVSKTFVVTGTITSHHVWLYVDTTVPFEISHMQVEDGNKVTPWRIAPEEVDSNINSAITRLDDIMSDAKITPDEKQSLYKEWLTIASEKTANDTQADTFGITTEKATYGTKYNNLNTYLNTTYPLFTNLTTTTPIDSGDTLRTKFKEYYDSRTALLNAISVKVQANLANLKVGGKNILVNSSRYSKATPYTLTGTVADSYIEIKDVTASLVAGTKYAIQCMSDGVWATHVIGQGGKKCTFWLCVHDGTNNQDACLTLDSTGKGFFTPAKTATYYLRLNVYASGDVVKFWDMKVEEGDKNTPWTPPIEDVQVAITTATTAAATADGKAAAANAAVIETNAALSQVQKALEDLETTTTTKFTQTASDFTFAIQQSIIPVLNTANAALTATQTSGTYIKYVADTVDPNLIHILIGDDANKLVLDICNNKLSFKMQGVEVAYMSNNKLSILNAEILEGGTLKIGKFGFIPRSNGNLSFRYLG